MQLINFTKGLKPITLAAGLIIASPAMMYADADKFTGVSSVVSDSSISKYSHELDRLAESTSTDRIRFRNLYNSWQKDTVFLSSVGDIIGHPAFKSIVSMGGTAVPFIVEEIKKRPSNLVWALNQIYNRKITNKDVTIEKACELWIKAL
ncbi:MAG: hypothetical protein IJM43_07030 [Bacteroidaceae bacterium]|nr:hypothetical protein [Bacteroidaceae bacterium]